MEFVLFEKVMVVKDVLFKDRGITIKKGTIGNIIDIVTSRFDSNKKGYILELPEYSDFDPTFIFEADEIVKTKKD